MKKLFLCLLALSLVACQPAEEPVADVNESSDIEIIDLNAIDATAIAVNDVNAIADQYIENLFTFSPELGTFYQIADADNVNLTDISPAGTARAEQAEDKLYEALSAVDVGQLAKNDTITYQLLKSQIEGSMQQRICHKNLWSMNHLDAFYIWYQYIGKNQPVGDDASRVDTLARWALNR